MRTEVNITCCCAIRQYTVARISSNSAASLPRPQHDRQLHHVTRAGSHEQVVSAQRTRHACQRAPHLLQRLVHGCAALTAGQARAERLQPAQRTQHAAARTAQQAQGRAQHAGHSSHTAGARQAHRHSLGQVGHNHLQSVKVAVCQLMADLN